MDCSIKKTMNKNKNIHDTYDYAFVAFPVGFGGIREPFYGTYDEFNAQYPDKI